MKRIFVVFIVLFSISPNLFSQSAPGYMGRRFNVGYGFSFSPATFGPNADGICLFPKKNGHAESGFAFNVFHEGFIEYAFKTRAMICASVKYYKTTFDNSSEVTANNIPVKAAETGNVTVMNQYEYYPRGTYSITGLNYALYFKIFHKRFVAPWGGYMLVGLTLNTFHCNYDPTIMKLKMSGNDYASGASVTGYLTDFGPQGQFYVRPDILYGFGKTRIIANRVSIDYGFTVQAFSLVTTVAELAFDNANIFAPRPTNTNYLESTAPVRVRGANKINAFLKVGFIF